MMKLSNSHSFNQLTRRSFLCTSGLAIASMATVTSCQSKPEATSSTAPLELGFNLWPGFMPWKVSEEKGLFKENGLDAKLNWFASLSDMLAAFNAEKIDVSGLTMSDFLNGVAAGLKTKVIAITDMSLGADAILAAPTIRSIKDFAGKSASVEVGTVGHMLFLKALEQNGVSEKDVQILNQVADAATSALIAGKTEIIYSYDPYMTQAIKTGKGRVLFSSKDVPGLIPDLLVIHEKVLQEKPDAAQKLLDVWYKTLNYRKVHLNEVLKIEAKQAGTSLEEYQALLKGFKWLTPQDCIKAFQPGNTTESMIHSAEVVADFMVKQKLVRNKPASFADFIEPRYVRQHMANRST
jgi:NitT/TauT family transport system substrate-binding protein